MKLSKLVAEVNGQPVQGDLDTEIRAIAYDSRKVIPGAVFVCIRGFQADGHQYAQKAMDAGASALIIEDEISVAGDVVIFRVSDSREALARMSAVWYGYPARQMTMIGITGTKGKTTTTHMIKRILEEAGYKVGMIGTIGAYIGREKAETHNTTPESYELQALFSQMLEEGCRYVVMEVSSQGLKQKRVEGIEFDYGAFLNLSPDHISEDQHKDFEEYKACKKLLFPQSKKAVINMDDRYGEEFRQEARDAFTVSVDRPSDLWGTKLQNVWNETLLGITFRAHGRLEEEITVSMPGAFSVENALVAAAITSLCGVSSEIIVRALRDVSVPGRTQLIRGTSHFASFLIDYAHNALSMESLLCMLKDYHPKRLICLFGAGGNRPKQRRYDMGDIAGKYADLTVITTDNPRYEPLEEINADIVRGLEVHGAEYKIIPDRKEAIEYLIDHTKKGDIVALIGKGHENYQEIEGVRYFFSEEQIILNYLQTK